VRAKRQRRNNASACLCKLNFFQAWTRISEHAETICNDGSQNLLSEVGKTLSVPWNSSRCGTKPKSLSLSDEGSVAAWVGRTRARRRPWGTPAVVLNLMRDLKRKRDGTRSLRRRRLLLSPQSAAHALFFSSAPHCRVFAHAKIGLSRSALLSLTD
jgi:hypothetical protein